MEKNTRIILGSAFLMLSGLLFTIERLSAKIYWFGQKQNNPETISLFSNLFIPSFFIIGIILIARTFKDKSLD